MTKKCCKCKEDKPLSEFNKSKSKKDGLSSACRECNKVYLIEHYNKNPEYYREKGKRHKQRVKAELQELKEELSCTVCGESANECLDFHHLDSKTKDKAVSKLAAEGNLKRMRKEIKKCVVLCSNCHRKVHSGRIQL